MKTLNLLLLLGLPFTFFSCNSGGQKTDANADTTDTTATEETNEMTDQNIEQTDELVATLNNAVGMDRKTATYEIESGSGTIEGAYDNDQLRILRMAIDNDMREERETFYLNNNGEVKYYTKYTKGDPCRTMDGRACVREVKVYLANTGDVYTAFQREVKVGGAPITSKAYAEITNYGEFESAVATRMERYKEILTAEEETAKTDGSADATKEDSKPKDPQQPTRPSKPAETVKELAIVGGQVTAGGKIRVGQKQSYVIESNRGEQYRIQLDCPSPAITADIVNAETGEQLGTASPNWSGTSNTLAGLKIRVYLDEAKANENESALYKLIINEGALEQ